jgi:phosphoribosylformylglycinamidine synthase
VQFHCEHVLIKVEQTDTPFTLACRPGQLLRIPIAHGEGNYYAEPDVIARLEKNRQIVFRYTNEEGVPTDASNPNGAAANIAGLCNEQRNVVGLMPHPERACEMALGSADGLVLFESVIEAVKHGAGRLPRTVVA